MWYICKLGERGLAFDSRWNALTRTKPFRSSPVTVTDIPLPSTLSDSLASVIHIQSRSINTISFRLYNNYILPVRISDKMLLSILIVQGGFSLKSIEAACSRFTQALLLKSMLPLDDDGNVFCSITSGWLDRAEIDESLLNPVRTLFINLNSIVSHYAKIPFYLVCSLQFSV